MTSHDDIRRAMRPHLLRLMPARFELPGPYWRRVCGYRLHLHIPMPRPPDCGRGGGGSNTLSRARSADIALMAWTRIRATFSSGS